MIIHTDTNSKGAELINQNELSMRRKKCYAPYEKMATVVKSLQHRISDRSH